MKNWAWSVIIAVLALVLLASASFYSVSMTQTAVVLQFGKAVRVVESPGLYMKWPIAQNVAFINKNLSSYSTQPESFLTVGKKPVLIGLFAEWRVADPLVFYARLHNDGTAESRIGDVAFCVADRGRQDDAEVGDTGPTQRNDGSGAGGGQ